MALPAVIYYLIFCYGPMYGAIIAFKNYSPKLGILGSEWVGLKHFESFLSSPYFLRILKNTLNISIQSLIFGFPAPIILALLINELTNKKFVKVTQTITYLPHFVSLVVVCGMIKSFTSDTGFITKIISLLSFGRWEPVSLLNEPKYFVPIYVLSDIWQGVGWGSIIYLSALSGIDGQLYEAAMIDGAGRFKQTIHVTLPGIIPMIMIMLILRMGGLLNVGYEKIILLYNQATYDTADVISTFVYRRGILAEGGSNQWSYSTAVGLFNSVINFMLIITANYLSKKFTDYGLW
ncbi:MAG: ABC transporter permease subunit [Clostridia bacterium]|nr:ABC transporter permease subunit [Clostridia bacterium]